MPEARLIYGAHESIIAKRDMRNVENRFQVLRPWF